MGKERKFLKIFQFFPQISCTVFFFALYLHSQSGNAGCNVLANAEIAQLVEHNLAKVGVASSSLVFRSKSQKRSRCFLDLFLFCLLGYVTYPPNPLSVKGAFGAESVVCTSDPTYPCQGVRGCKYSSRKMPANAGSSLVFRSKSKSFKDKIKQNPLKHRFRGFFICCRSVSLRHGRAPTRHSPNLEVSLRISTVKIRDTYSEIRGHCGLWDKFF